MEYKSEKRVPYLVLLETDLLLDAIESRLKRLHQTVF